MAGGRAKERLPHLAFGILLLTAEGAGQVEARVVMYALSSSQGSTGQELISSNVYRTSARRWHWTWVRAGRVVNAAVQGRSFTLRRPKLLSGKQVVSAEVYGSLRRVRGTREREETGG